MSLRTTKSTSLIIGLGLVMAVALCLTWVPQLDRLASDYLTASITDNLVIYATARTINGLISVIQSIEISVSLGAGMAVNLGEVLDPLNDLIERFSGFVLYALAGLGLQQLVLAVSSSVLTKILTSLVLVGGFLIWLSRNSMPSWFKQLLFLFILVRFAFVVEVGFAWVLDKTYFDDQQQQAVSNLDIARDKLQGVRDQYEEVMSRKGVFSGLWSSAGNIFAADDQSGIADLAAGAIVQLIVIMLVRSILLPLGFMWFVVFLFRRVTAPDGAW